MAVERTLNRVNRIVFENMRGAIDDIVDDIVESSKVSGVSQSDVLDGVVIELYELYDHLVESDRFDVPSAFLEDMYHETGEYAFPAYEIDTEEVAKVFFNYAIDEIHTEAMRDDDYNEDYVSRTPPL